MRRPSAAGIPPRSRVLGQPLERDAPVVDMSRSLCRIPHHVSPSFTNLPLLPIHLTRAPRPIPAHPRQDFAKPTGARGTPCAPAPRHPTARNGAPRRAPARQRSSSCERRVNERFVFPLHRRQSATCLQGSAPAGGGEPCRHVAREIALPREKGCAMQAGRLVEWLGKPRERIRT